ncbi:hypothetical protein DV711_13155 [Motiliproteus coralliicola]|uniref:Ni,Fe-hydrogenase I large subunit n=1 Tax=Motiliproteus coralliicola TaxID=2283196 RepID=A0A369WK32_9GAMM|nr:hypothetical protein [Motiliproteus coralliicola]RDE19815.1 hypothetical protein DV711_13155 [Motiliproteus coralliicola]
MGFEGKVCIDAGQDGRGGATLKVDLQRPQLAQRLLAGVEPSQALSRVEQVFVVCRQSQRAAAMEALGLPRDPRLLQQKVLLESIEQLLWRLSIDLPHSLALGAGMEPFAVIRRYISQQLAAESLDAHGDELIQTLEGFFASLSGVSCSEFLAFDRAQFESWLEIYNGLVPLCLRQVARVSIAPAPEGRGHGPVGLLPKQPVETLGLDQQLADPDIGEKFCQQPSLDQQPRETGPLAYMQSWPLIKQLQQASASPLLLRYAAKLLYLASLISRDALLQPQGICGSVALDEGRLGWVNSVRGLLLHWVKLDASETEIAEYRICAPTEWNFHPQGQFSRLASQVGIDHPQRKLALEQIALALDPCVPFEVRIQA